MCVNNYVSIQPDKKHIRHSLINLNISVLTTILIKIKYRRRHQLNSKIIQQQHHAMNTRTKSICGMTTFFQSVGQRSCPLRW